MSLLLLFKGGSTAAGFRSLALELGIGASPGLSLDAGSFTVSGQDAALKRGRRLQADAGSYTALGQDATLRRSGILRADAGSYSLNGAAANLLAGRKALGEAGSYSLSGQDAALSYVQNNAGFRSLALEIGAGAVTSATVTAEPGTYSVSGQDAALRRGLRLVAEAGSYTYTGVAAQRDVVVTAAAGTYSVTGYDATLTTATSVGGGFFSLLLEIGGGAIVDLVERGDGVDAAWTKKQRRERDRKLAEERERKDELRQLLKRALDPVVDEPAVEVVTLDDGVVVIPSAGPAVAVPRPEGIDLRAMSREIGKILADAKVQAERTRRAQAREIARVALEQARENLRRLIRKRQQEEFLLLMT